MSFDQALDFVLQEVSITKKLDPSVRPVRVIDGGRVLVTLRDFAEIRTRTVFYDIRDLVGNALDEGTRADRITRITNEIKSVDPETFVDGPDAPGQIHEYRNILMIRQTLRNHERIMEFISAKRRALSEAYDNPVRPGRSR